MRPELNLKVAREAERTGIMPETLRDTGLGSRCRPEKSERSSGRGFEDLLLYSRISLDKAVHSLTKVLPPPERSAGLEQPSSAV